MSTTALVGPTLTDVRSVVTEVWASFVGDGDLLLPRPPGTAYDAPVWCGAVSVAGGWEGSVTVELAEPVARTITLAMLGIDDAGDLSEDDVADAVGELVNMVGGNVKSLMPGPSTLSLPAVAAGRAVFPSDAREVAHLDLQWAGAPVRVSVHCPERTR